jgi:hypothetical protein
MPLQGCLKHMLKQRAERGLSFLSLGVLLVIGHAGLAEVRSGLAADRPSAPEIIIDPEYRVTAGEKIPLALRITNMEALPPQTVVLIRGLPPEIHLSEGKAFQSGVWVVASNRISKMRLEIPASLTGRNNISIAVATLEGNYLAETRTTLVIVPPPVAVVGMLRPDDAKGDQPAADPPVQTALVPFRLTAETRALAMKFMADGDNSMKVSNVLVARQFYQRAAEQGLPEAARALAATYDAKQLAKIKNLVGILPDPGLAKKWYAIADELESRETAAQPR